MKVLATAVIGLGRAGWQIHMPEVLKHQNYNLIAVVDPLQERLDEARRAIGVKGYRDCDSLFSKEDPDLVVIASPTHFHAEQTNLAFEHGANVLCDKPMASSLKEADTMILSMEKHGRKLMIYQPHRSYVETVALLDILKRNLIGRVYMIKRAWTRYRFRVDWQAIQKYGGGEINNSGAHFIDQLLYISGSRAKKLTCFSRKIISCGDAEDMAKILIQTENGVLLDLDINMAAAIPIPPWQILGERGSIIWDENGPSWQVRYYLQEELPGFNLQNNLAADNRSYGDDQNIPWQEEKFPVSDYQAVDFYAKAYEFFAQGQKPFIPVSESREVMRLVEESRRKIDLSEVF
jgi:scyllo-inositol 2-dehydrogenase (NADP+)